MRKITMTLAAAIFVVGSVGLAGRFQPQCASAERHHHPQGRVRRLGPLVPAR
jgi:hypothetical protein